MRRTGEVGDVDVGGANEGVTTVQNGNGEAPFKEAGSDVLLCYL